MVGASPQAISLLAACLVVAAFPLASAEEEGSDECIVGYVGSAPFLGVRFGVGDTVHLTVSTAGESQSVTLAIRPSACRVVNPADIIGEIQRMTGGGIPYDQLPRVPGLP